MIDPNISKVLVSDFDLYRMLSGEKIYPRRNVYDDIFPPQGARRTRRRVGDFYSRLSAVVARNTRSVAEFLTLLLKYATTPNMGMIMSQQRMKAPPRSCRPPNHSSLPRPFP